MTLQPYDSGTIKPIVERYLTKTILEMNCFRIIENQIEIPYASIKTIIFEIEFTTGNIFSTIYFA